MGRFSRRWLTTPFVGLLALSGCNLLNTADDEDVAGRGPTAVDPYGGDLSGVIKLGLQQFNGCAIKATGEPVGPGSALIPYPDTCYNYQFGLEDPFPAGDPMPILVGTRFFLDKLSLVQVVENLHTNQNGMTEVANWMANESQFSALDWTNLTVTRDRWIRAGDLTRRVEFGGANWMVDRSGQTFHLELLDASGQMRSEVTYNRSDLVAESEAAGHFRIMWEANGVGTPRFPGDTEMVPGPEDEPLYSTVLRIEFTGSATPFTTLDVPNTMTGDGAIRVTWSAMPDSPFYFPVRFVANDALDPSCYDREGNPVGCRYGLDSEVAISYPEGRDYYLPGEKVVFNVSLKDSLGNYLHPGTGLPSYGDYIFDSANGLLYFSQAHWDYLREADSTTFFKVAGPKQDMVPSYQADPPWFEWPEAHTVAPTLYPYFFVIPFAETAPLATKYEFPLPEDAKAGSYSLQIKTHRSWMGERVADLKAFEFRVGDGPDTEYPNRVGNCQICHRGVLSLDNLRHGANVDEVEGCKACHGIPLFSKVLAQDIHAIHMNSQAYAADKNDCTMCHLTNESATRPSYAVCSTCHAGLHGNEYFDLELAEEGASPGAFGNCAQACHVASPPSRHILPAP